MARGSVTPSGHASRRSRLSGSVRAAAPLLRVRRDRAPVVRRAGGADAHAGLRHEAAERREQRCDPQQRLGVGCERPLRAAARATSASPAGIDGPRSAGAARAATSARKAAASRARLLRRIGADALHRDAVGARELADHAGVRGIEAAAESGAAGADQERDRGGGFADALRAHGQPPLGLFAPGDRQRVGRVGRDLAALQRGVRHRDEHAHDRLARVERGAERRRASAGRRCRRPRSSAR